MTNTPEARIDMYLHCHTCFKDHGRTDDGQWRGYSTDEKLAVGWTKEGLQVVCENCGKNIIDLDFKGQKVGLYKKDGDKLCK